MYLTIVRIRSPFDDDNYDDDTDDDDGNDDDDDDVQCHKIIV